MLKKITLMLVILLGLHLVPSGFMVGDVFAQAAPLPGETLDDPTFMFDLSSITHEGIEGSVRQGWIRSGINYFLERIIGFLAAIIGSLSVLVLVIGGFLMLSSAGNETQYEKGKNLSKYALIGLVLTLSAYILVMLVQLLIRSIYGY